MVFDACVTQRYIFEATECKDGLVHALGVEHLEADEQVENAIKFT